MIRCLFNALLAWHLKMRLARPFSSNLIATQYSTYLGLYLGGFPILRQKWLLWVLKLSSVHTTSLKPLLASHRLFIAHWSRFALLTPWTGVHGSAGNPLNANPNCSQQRRIVLSEIKIRFPSRSWCNWAAVVSSSFHVSFDAQSEPSPQLLSC